MDLLEANLKILKERYPGLADAYQEPEGIEILKGKNNYPSLKFKKILLHSKYNPITEANRLIDSIDLARADLIFVFGFGLGYHLQELLRRANPQTLILVIEPEVDIFSAALSLVDLRQVFTFPHLELSIGEGPERVLERLNRKFELIKIRKSHILEHPPSIKLNPVYFRDLKARIQDFIDQKVTQALTLSRFGYDFQRNIIRNIPYIVGQPGVSKLFGRFKSMPAVIIAAGPSLDKDLETLKKAKDKALLICVDTALRTLLDQGIRPDLVVAIDPQEINSRYFKDLDLSSLFLVVASIAYWRIGELPASKFFFLTDHPICRWLAEFDDKGLIDTGGGSVTTASFDLALKLGADPIVLFGTDFAYPGELTHARSIFENGNNMDTLSKFHTLEMMRRESLARNSVFFTEGVAGKRVSTDKVLYGYLGWLEERIGQLALGRKIINVSNGARIKGTQELTLKEALDLYCQRELSIKRIIEESWSVQPGIDSASLIQGIEIVIKELAEIEELSGQGVKVWGLDRYGKTMNLLEVAFYSATFNELYGISKGEDQGLGRGVIWAKGLAKTCSFTRKLFEEIKDKLE